MEFKMLRFVVEDAVATITLDYAPTLNALAPVVRFAAAGISVS